MMAERRRLLEIDSKAANAYESPSYYKAPLVAPLVAAAPPSPAPLVALEALTAKMNMSHAKTWSELDTPLEADGADGESVEGSVESEYAAEKRRKIARGRLLNARRSEMFKKSYNKRQRERR